MKSDMHHQGQGAPLKIKLASVMWNKQLCWHAYIKFLITSLNTCMHNLENGIIILQAGGLLHSPPAAPNLYFRSCRSSYIPATECCKKGCERADLAAMKRS